MSLINDALKKAQRERGETPSVSNAPMPGGGSAMTARANAKSGPKPPFLLLGAGALLGVLVALGAVLWLRPASAPPAGSSPTTVASTPRAAEAQASSPAPSAATPAATKPAESAPIVKSEPPIVAAATPTPSSTATPTTVEPIAAPASGPASEATAPVPTGPLTPSARMVEVIEAFRVTGIRAGSGADAKVLMNDRVFRLGETVDHALGIKLIAATPNSLTFRDSSGATYTRNF